MEKEEICIGKKDKKTNKIKQFFKGDFAFIFVSQVLYKMASFCSSIFLARLLTKADYGLFAYTSNIISFFLLLNGLGTVDALLQVGCENDSNFQKKMSYSFFSLKVGVITNAIITLAIVGVSLIMKFPLENASTILLIMAAQPVLMYINNYLMCNMRINKREKAYSVQNLLSGVLIVLGGIIGAVVGGVYGIVIAQAIAYVVIVAIGFCICFKDIKFTKISLEKKDKLSFLKLSVSFIAIIIVSHLFVIMDIFVIGIIIPNDEIIASYKIASVVPSALAFLPGAIMLYAYPYFAKRKNSYEWIRKQTRKIVLGCLIAFVLIGVLLFILAPWVITLLYGEQYLNSVAPFRVLIVSFVFSASFNVTLSNILISQRKMKYNIIVSIVLGALNVLFNVIFILQYGSIGAAYATLLVTLIGTVLYVLFYFKTMKEMKKISLKETENTTKEDKPES